MITVTAMTPSTRSLARVIAAGMMVLGGAAVLLPFYVGFATAVLLGLGIAAVGGVGLLISRQVRQAGYRYSSGGMYWFYLIAGLVLALVPQLALGTVALLLGLFLLFSGIMGWRAAVPGAGVGRITSGLTIALGILVIVSGASGAAWLIGLVLGISVFMQGLSLWQSVSQAPVIIE